MAEHSVSKTKPSPYQCVFWIPAVCLSLQPCCILLRPIPTWWRIPNLDFAGVLFGHSGTSAHSIGVGIVIQHNAGKVEVPAFIRCHFTPERFTEFLLEILDSGTFPQSAFAVQWHLDERCGIQVRWLSRYMTNIVENVWMICGEQHAQQHGHPMRRVRQYLAERTGLAANLSGESGRPALLLQPLCHFRVQHKVMLYRGFIQEKPISVVYAKLDTALPESVFVGIAFGNAQPEGGK